MSLNPFTCFSFPEFNIVAHYTGNREKWLGRTVNIKEANKQAEIYVERPFILHIFCFRLIDYP